MLFWSLIFKNHREIHASYCTGRGLTSDLDCVHLSKFRFCESDGLAPVFAFNYMQFLDQGQKGYVGDWDPDRWSLGSLMILFSQIFLFPDLYQLWLFILGYKVTESVNSWCMLFYVSIHRGTPSERKRAAFIFTSSTRKDNLFNMSIFNCTNLITNHITSFFFLA